MTGKTITELALDAIDQALAESISAQPGSAVSPVRSGVVSRHRALNNVQIDKRGCIIDGRGAQDRNSCSKIITARGDTVR